MHVPLEHHTHNTQSAHNKDFTLVLRTPHGRELWLGDAAAAANLSGLRQRGIRSVLTVAALLGVSFPPEELITHKVISAFDLPRYRLDAHFQEAIHFMAASLARGNLLIHCATGVSRSPTVVIAFLMATQEKSFQMAFDLVKRRRPVIRLNEGFLNELKTFEATIQRQMPIINQSASEQAGKTELSAHGKRAQDGRAGQKSSSKRLHSVGPIKSLSYRLFLSLDTRHARPKSQSSQLLSTGAPPREQRHPSELPRQNRRGLGARLTIFKLSRQFMALKPHLSLAS